MTSVISPYDSSALASQQYASVLNGIRDNTVELGFGATATALRQQFQNVEQHYYTPTVRTPIKKLFVSLATTWQHDTTYSSSANDIILHPAYQQIIGMGKEALPFIFEELLADTNHWFWALKSISRADPVKEQHMGNLELMKADWLMWGIEHGYILRTSTN